VAAEAARAVFRYLRASAPPLQKNLA